MAGASGLVSLAAAQTGVQFDGSTQYIRATQSLAASQFTIELWFRRDGAGAGTGTGTGGLASAVPLVAKGAAQAEDNVNDLNYFLGISSTNTLCADFEHFAGAGSSPNHPLTAPAGPSSTISNGVWYHGALTYDGATMKLYLNGNLVAQATPNVTPAAATNSYVAMATTVRSDNLLAAGFFNGVMDEVRIWNVARSQCEITGSMNLELTSGTGLIARWGLNDGSGTVATNSIGGAPNGNLLPVATPPLWAAGSPFNASVPPPPADPSGLTVSAPNPNQVQLGWTDAATTEAGYEVERSTAGAAGPFALLASLGPNSTTYNDLTVGASMPYWYRVRATGSCGNSGYSSVGSATTPAEPCNALAFSPAASGGYATFGQAPGLGVSTFTLETWFKRTGTGVGTNTGAGGLNPILPLITKGMAEGDASTVDMNYFLGIATGGANPVLAADYEEGTGQANPGLNHPVQGVTPILTNTWYHAAATFDGTTFRLYLNGILEATLTVGAGRLPQSASLQHAALATALGSGGTGPSGQTQGFFAGALDEARIWNVARTESEIRSTINSQISATTSGLIGRWGMNEISGTTVIATAGTTTHGTLVGSQPSQWDRVACAPFNLDFNPPAAPTVFTATAFSTAQIDLGWTDVATTETGYELERSTTGIDGTYTLLVALPAGSTGYSNTGLTPTTEYCYRVRAVNGFGGSSYAGPTCATTLAPAPPVAPTNLVATPSGFSQIHLTWTDNATTETGFEVERSTTGIGGTYSLVTTLGVDAVSYDDLNRSPAAEYCYRVRAINGSGPSGDAGPTCATTPGSALDFGSAGTTYVTFGDPAALDLAQFTVECWFRRDGTGVTTTTGSGSIPDAIPLVTHGAQEADGDTRDMNFFLGIKNAGGVLCADFEEGPGGTGPLGLNHPIVGVTPVGSGWNHAAVSYDGSTWRLYLNGNLDASLAVGQPVRSNTTQQAALATSLNSTGGTNGFFDGVLDEVRVWSVVRTQAEIQSAANAQITTTTAGLVARWGLDEGQGTAVNGSAGTTVNGTVTGANSTWAAGAPFNLSFTPPDPPTGLAATANTYSQITLSWTDIATNEAGYEIRRSTTGIDGSYSLLITVAANTTSYADLGLAAESEYCYQVRAVNSSGSSAYDGPVCATTPVPSNTALGFSGSTAQPSYASFGNPAALQLSTLTIEMWLRRDGAGEGTNTGTGGFLDVIPLVAKGRAESETATTDINYLFGIRASSGALCADFEEGAAGAAPSLNHPIEGATPLAVGTWYHAAVTYDGSAWKLYLNGNLDASVDVGQPVASASTVAVALASALTSTNVPAGFFNGAMDEVRIWSVARDQAQIRSTANVQIASPTPGLVARWSLDEGTGTAIGASAGTTVNGTITGPNYAWSSPGAPFNLAFNQQPGAPVLVGPANGGTGVPTSPSLQVTASDPDGGNLSVTYYGRPIAGSPGPDFTLIGLPDTQYYSGELNGGTNAIFQSQTNWIVANRASRNIVYVGQLGDCVEHGDNGGNDIEWQRANLSMGFLEDPATTGLPQGIPFGVCAGNHDQSPIGNADGTTTFYNQYFGTARFSGRAYYGGNYGSNNDNWYDLFSASGMDFIVISFEYDTTPDAAVLTWADNLLTTNSNRRGIVLSHFICNTGNPAGFGPQGQAIYDALKSHPNLDLMLCGHVPGEGRRQDTFAGNTVYTMLSDYQSRTNGGNGWLRILEFSPANNEIRVKTYSPWLNQFENDADSQFSLTYDMVSAPAFQPIGTVAGVPSGSNSTLVWAGLTPGAGYEWYATVSDGASTTVGPVWTFTTGAGAPVAAVTNLNATPMVPGTAGQATLPVQLTWDAPPPGTTVEVWRKGFGGYPRYDDGGGTVPGASASYPPGAGWAKVDGLDTPGETDLVAGRDVLYYVAYARDVFGTWSPTSTMTAGTLNYHLGDVSNGLTAGQGNNTVFSEDVSLLGAHYGASGAALTAVNYLDVGPTSSGLADGRPLTDGLVDFEDLVMFALNYGVGQTGPVAPLARRTAGPASSSSSSSGNELLIEAPSRVVAGEVVTARLKLRSAGTLIAVSTRLEWDPAVVEPVEQAAGAWLTGQEGLVFSPAPGAVDAAVMGGHGMVGEGELATVSFRVLSAGDPRLQIAAVAGRDARNRAVTIASPARSAGTAVPLTTRLTFARPNPFIGSVTLGFGLATPEAVELAIFGVDGRKVRTLVQETREAGEYEEVWDGRDDHGAAAGAGVYYARLVTPHGGFTRRVINLK